MYSKQPSKFSSAPLASLKATWPCSLLLLLLLLRLFVCFLLAKGDGDGDVDVDGAGELPSVCALGKCVENANKQALRGT